ncbi:hypothetical protein ABEB36_008022 [Hypothenemus hampei]|uniref:AD domain-containing protein n=1 Tax=Hypothenemus hampei TaxID=57062 RepID=A0ABD1EKF3_HYPHA
MDFAEDNIFHNNVLHMKNLIGKTVKLLTKDQQAITGDVYVIDPIYKSVVLHTRDSSPNKHDAVLVLYHAIESIEVISEEIKQGYLNGAVPERDMCNVDFEKRRLIKWLKQMGIDATESGDNLEITDHLLIVPPYGIDDCICNNTIILERIRNLIGLMPQEFS